MNFFNLWLQQDHIPLFYNITSCGKHFLNGYDFMGVNQSLYGEK